MTANTQQIKHTAIAFYLAYKRCMKPLANFESNEQILFIPAIVCGLLSVEISWKFIIKKCGRIAYGHKLDDLYAKLDENTQTILVQTSGMTRDNFLRSLQKMSNSFVEWRYIYEQDKKELDLQFLQIIMSINQKLLDDENEMIK